mgnify:FL=1
MLSVGCLKYSLPLVIGFSKSHPDVAKLVALFNRGLAKLKRSGRLGQLMVKYQLDTSLQPIINRLAVQ